VRPLSLFALLLFLPLRLCAEGAIPFPIHGSVNVITGQYMEDTPQIILNSPFELGLVRTYVGPDKEQKPVCWSMGASYLTFDQEGSDKALPTSFLVDEPSGSHTIYNYDQGKREWIADLKGLSNHTGAPLQETFFNRFQEKNGQTAFTMNRGHGERLIFSSPKTIQSSFFSEAGSRCLPLARVERLSGERIEVEYEEKGAFDERAPPKKMTLHSPSGLELGWIQYHYQGHRGIAFLDAAQENYSLFASDGQRIDYKIDYGAHRLREVVRPGWPTVSYRYDTSTHSHYTRPEQKDLVRLTRRQEGDLFLENSYYEASKKTKGAKVGKDRVQHPVVNCVKQQFANVGETKEERVSIAHYTYHFEPNKDFAPGEVSGWTDVIDATGNRTRYTWGKGQQITSIERYRGQNDLLLHESYSVKDSYGWSKLGKVVSDANGPVMKVTCEYSPSGNILSTEISGDLKGNREIDCFRHDFKYLSKGRLQEEQVGTLRKVYTYLGESDLVSSISLFDGKELIEETIYEYDENGVVIQQEHRSGSRLFTTKIEPVKEGPAVGFPRKIEEYAGDQLLGAVERTYGLYNLPTSETYFDANNLPRYTLYAEYDEGGRPTWVTDPMGYATALEYDELGRLKSTIGARQEKRTYEYDHANRLIATAAHLADGLSLTGRYGYDRHSRVTRASGPYGQTTIYCYNPLDQLIESGLSGSGSACRYTHDIFGNCTQIISELGEVERHRYTIRGQVAESEYADGTKERYAYDLNGNLVKKVDRLGIVTTATYNALGQLTSISELSRDGAQGKELHLTYDGDLLVSTNDGKLETRMEYDAAGRLIGVESGEHLTKLEYDELGRQSRQIVWFGYDPNDHIDTVWEYDLCNRVTQERLEDGEGKVWQRVDYTYDSAGNLLSVGEGEGVSTFEYDLLNRVTRSTDPLGYPTTYIYGEEDSVTDPLGNVTRQSYDRFGRVASVERTDNRGTLLTRTEYSYDAVGRIIEERRPVLLDGQEIDSQTIRYQYGPGGRLEAIHEEMGKTTRFEYNDCGQCTVKILPRGDRVAYTYDSFGRLLDERIEGADFLYRYAYDCNGNIISAEGCDGVTRRSYDLYNQLISEQLSNGLAVSHTYDGAGRRLSTLLPDGSSVLYTHDPIGVCQVKRSSLSHAVVSRDLSGRPLLERSEPGGLEWSYQWDLAGALVKSCSPDGVVNLAYDELGRLISAQGRDGTGRLSESYSYDGLSQLVSESNNTWKYDSLGNRREKGLEPDRLNRCNGGYNENHCVQNIDGMACDYDSRGRLILLCTTSERWIYTYDAWDRRVGERHVTSWSDESCHYLYDGDVEIGCFGADRSELRLMMDRGGWQRPRTIGLEVAGDTFSAETNFRGDITALFDERGRCAESMRYSAFGNQEVDGRAISPWGFAGKRLDDSGLVYFGRRHYLPSEGRWMTPDPWGFVDGPNLYCYCHNNPLSLIDWIGLASEEFGRKGEGLFRDPPMKVPPKKLPPGGGGRPGPRFDDGRLTPPNPILRYFEDEPRVKKPKTERPKLHLPQRSWTTTFSGSLRAFGGVLEISVGTALFMTGFGAPFGLLIIAHGFDQSFAGMKTVWSGRHIKSLTCQGLEWVGVSAGSADLIDSGISAAVTMGVGAYIYTAERAALHVFRIPSQMVVKSESATAGIIRTQSLHLPESLNRFDRAAYSLSPAGQANIRALRGWAKSNGWVQLPNQRGAPETWGIYRNGSFEWRVKIKPEPTLRPGIQEGSHLPRFDARVELGGEGYINPFTGEIGSRGVGTHIPLDYPYW
jgi:RHS repeat-associated protein